MTTLMPRLSWSRTVAMMSTSRDSSMTSSFASAAAARNASTSAGGSFTPEERFRKTMPFAGNFVRLRGVEHAGLSTGVSMKKFVVAAVLLQFLVLPLFGADAPKECTLCVGVVAPDGAGVPTLSRVREADLAAYAPARPS